MNSPLHRVLMALAVSLTLTACVVYDPYYPQPNPQATYDRSWDAAMGAMQDSGVAVGNADRGSGVIHGTKGSASVTMTLRSQGDGGVRVELNARGSGNDTALANMVNQAYERRMGR